MSSQQQEAEESSSSSSTTTSSSSIDILTGLSMHEYLDTKEDEPTAQTSDDNHTRHPSHNHGWAAPSNAPLGKPATRASTTATLLVVPSSSWKLWEDVPSFLKHLVVQVDRAVIPDIAWCDIPGKGSGLIYTPLNKKKNTSHIRLADSILCTEQAWCFVPSDTTTSTTNAMIPSCQNCGKSLANCPAGFPFPEYWPHNSTQRNIFHPCCCECNSVFCSNHCYERFKRDYAPYKACQLEYRSSEPRFAITDPAIVLAVRVTARIFSIQQQTQTLPTLPLCGQAEDVHILLQDHPDQAVLDHVYQTHIAVLFPTISWSHFQQIVAICMRNAIGFTPLSPFSSYYPQVIGRVGRNHKPTFQQIERVLLKNAAEGTTSALLQRDQLDRLVQQQVAVPLIGLFPFLAQMNHSCEETATAQFTSAYTTACLDLTRTNSSLQEGQEITINYLPSRNRRMSKHARQQLLRAKYLFSCLCEKCAP